MKAADLRIDNWVEFLGKEMQLMGLTKHNGKNETARHYAEFKGLVPIKLMHLKPIPLTEEWLLKFGFEKYEFDHKENQYRFKERLLVIRKGFFCDYGTSVELKHVHQLQNLYYALTGEELTLETNVSE
tara:strand:+ start:16534 stop:16917 length:384 start_codon:yes stop_codon:yes gene_type:complete